MDWLGKCRVQIDCDDLNISLRGPNKDRISDREIIAKPIIKVSTHLFETYVRKGYPVLLCQVKDISGGEKLSGIPAVEKNLAMFREEIPRMALECFVVEKLSL